MGTINKAKTSKVIICILALIIMLTTIFAVVTDKLSVAQADSELLLREEKIYSHTSVEEDFEEDTLMVVMDKYVSGYNKNQNMIFDSIAGIENIEDLTYITGHLDEKEYLNRESFRQILKISLQEESKQNVINTIDKIQKLDGVLWAGVNGYYSAPEVSSLQESSDILYKVQWGLNGTYGINVEEAWKYTKGSKSIRVGVIDTGIADHEDLRPNLVAGWDFYNDNEITTDDLKGHGTHVAGIIGANSAKENGLKGVCPNVQLVPLQVLIPEKADDDYCIDSVSTVKAITWATNNKIDILNFSIGATNSVSFRTALENYKGLIVCAAGNGKNNNDENPIYPANYSTYPSEDVHVISVGAINIDGGIYWNSNYGQNTVSLMAPGSGIWSTYPSGCKWESTYNPGYAAHTGTSMAAPFVTGVAALIYSKYLSNAHNLSKSEIARQVKETILDTVTEDDRYSKACYTGGRLNAGEALKKVIYKSRVLKDFGYKYLTNQWIGHIDMILDGGSDSFDISEDGTPIVHWGDLKFAIGTSICYNAWKKIDGLVIIKLTNSAGEEAYIYDKRFLVNIYVEVGLISNVSYKYGKFEIPVAGLEEDTYTLSLSCRSIRNNNIQTTTSQYTFIVDR